MRENIYTNKGHDLNTTSNNLILPIKGGFLVSQKKSVLFIFLLVCVTTLVACNGKQTEDSGTDDFTIAGSTLGGVFYAQSSALADMSNDHFDDFRFTVEATSGGHENAIMVENQNNTMGISTTLAVYEFINGLSDFPTKAKNLTAIAYANPTQLHLVVPEDSDIQSVYDLKGKVVNPGTKGSGTESSIPSLLQPLGLSYDDFARVEYLSFSDAADGMRDGDVDAIFWLGGYPASSIEELATTVGIKIIPFSDEDITAIEEASPSFSRTTIPGGVYEGVDQDIETISLNSLFLVNKNVPDELVYDLTKLISENIDQLSRNHSAFQTWEFNREFEEIVPIHPGASKYYEEQGW